MVSRADVIRCYRNILGREPESEAAIDSHLPCADRWLLAAAFVGSEEYRASSRSRPEPGGSLSPDQMDQAVGAFLRGEFDRWRGYALALPDWFDRELAPHGDAFREQMIRLWTLITERSSYDPQIDEDAPEITEADAIARPAFYGTGDTAFAGGQLMAMGHILMRSGIRPGQRVLEYGAGFGLTALAFARLGAKVDTVDVNPAFCRAVGAIADRYQADLTPHAGVFGYNPAGGPNAYDLIFFYESFHHCLEFEALIAKLRGLLTRTGKVILAGEPIFDGYCPEMPYDWGFRLDWENVSVMRIRGWMELGFQKTYLIERFAQAGFDCTIHSDPNSHWAQIYEFRQRG